MGEDRVALPLPPVRENWYCHTCYRTTDHKTILVRFSDGRRRTYYICPVCGRQKESR